MIRLFRMTCVVHERDVVVRASLNQREETASAA